MTIEIADRLVKLRKKYGYSQEELADKLGLSRQAVSKWERAEASPDTDNLICLAKLYGVSLDQLLATDDDVDTIVNEQVKKEEQPEPEPEVEQEDPEPKDSGTKKSGDRVVINDEGIFVTDDDGSRVVIDKKGVHCYDKDCKKAKKHYPDRAMAIIGGVEGLLFILSVIAYILLGTLLNMWYNAWVVFFVPEIVCSIARAIRKKNAQHFNVTFATLFAFFFVCMVLPGLGANLWHPMWVVVFAIPIYHTSVSLIHKIMGRERFIEEDGETESDDDDDDVIENEADNDGDDD